MKTIKFVLGLGDSDGEIISRILNVEWGDKLEKELAAFPHLNYKDILADTLVKELKDSINLKLIKELIDDVTDISV